ncbi:MAG TPA: AAA family ATPase, partial [Polyangiales bacterium]|nr:AAA family ATPase [Polyangiales bacterium]
MNRSESAAELEFLRKEGERLKARVKARLLGRPELVPRIRHFSLVRMLGQGAHGVVHEAVDTRSGATVALKLLRDQRAGNIVRFKQEFRGLAHLAHENLVQLHELFVDGEEWFFTMELVRGVPFTDYVRTGARGSDRCDLEKLQPALIALLGAVQAVHDAGRLHCDLKPSNVLVTPAGRLVVLDFGLVTELNDRREDTELGTSAAIGTPTYMAPELGTGGPPTSATDAYAIGIMLSEALRGSPIAPANDAASRTLGLLQEICAGFLERDPAARLTIDNALLQLGSPGVAEHARGTQRAPSSAFVGRDRELAALLDAFARARAGAALAVFVHGPSGMGKTALCDRLAQELRGQALVLRGRCHERESLPYKAFDGLIDALARQLRTWPSEQVQALASALSPASAAALLRVFPSLRDNSLWPAIQIAPAPANPGELRQQAFASLKALLRRAAERKPLVLIVDDLQWADLDSARLLFELLGPPAAPALLYVGCYRSEETERSEFLREVLGPAAAEIWQAQQKIIALEALQEDQALLLATRLLEGRGANPGLAASRIARESAGVPFLVTELARHFASDPRDRDAVPSLSDLLSQRVAALSPSARRALGLLALAARPVGQHLIARALADDPSWERSLRMLSVSGLVRSGPDGELVVYHDRLREQVVRLLSDAEAIALHRALAETYEGARGSEPEWLIEHFHGAGDAARAFDYAIAAAELAVNKLAFNRAAALYRTALQLSASDDPRTCELHAKLGDALVNAGRSAEAASAFLDAVPHAAEDTAIALRCRAVQQYLRSGRSSEGRALLKGLLRDVGIAYPATDRALYLQLGLCRARLSLRAAWRGSREPDASEAARRKLLVLESVFRECAVTDPLLGALFQSLFHEEALRVGSSEALFMALAWEAYNQAFLGGFGARRSTARRIHQLEALTSEVKSPYAQGTLAMIRCAAALFEARHSEVDQLGRDAESVFRRHCFGTYWEESVCATLRYTALEVTGPLTAFCEDAPKLLRRANETSDEFSESVLSRTMTLSLLAQDEPGRALEFLSDPLASLDDEHVDLRTVVVTMSVADSHSYAGNPLDAWRSFDRSWDQYTKSLLARSRYLRL